MLGEVVACRSTTALSQRGPGCACWHRTEAVWENEDTMLYMQTLYAPCTQGTLVLALLCLLTSSAWGYRPFVSTDAAVIDSREVEIEL